MVTIIPLSHLEGEDEAGSVALDDAIAANLRALTALQEGAGANPAILAALEAQDYTAADVVAVSTGADGAVFVYVDDR